MGFSQCDHKKQTTTNNIRKEKQIKIQQKSYFHFSERFITSLIVEVYSSFPLNPVTIPMKKCSSGNLCMCCVSELCHSKISLKREVLIITKSFYFVFLLILITLLLGNNVFFYILNWQYLPVLNVSFAKFTLTRLYFDHQKLVLLN